MKVIEQNPYRILGVYSNSPKKEVIANKNKMSAFLKVGKRVGFSLDLNGILSSIERNNDAVTKADAALTLPKGQVEAGQFWFVKMSGIDEVAFNHLLVGDMENAMAIWEKKECASSLQNRLVCYLICGEYQDAIECAERLYENYLSELVVAIVGENFTVNEEDFIGRFEDAILSEKVLKPMDFMKSVHSEKWKNHLKDAVVEPLVKQITDAIEESNKVEREDSEGNLLAGTKLMNSTKSSLESLRQILSITDLVYEKIADKLGLRILQCSINYYNATTDIDSEYKALDLQKYAASVVVGSIARDRCNENGIRLKKLIEDFPQNKNLISEYKSLMSILLEFSKNDDKLNSATQLLYKTKPILKSFKEKTNKEDADYLKNSTRVAQLAMQKVIAEVNSYFKKLDTMKSLYGEQAFPYAMKMEHVDIESFVDVIWGVINSISKLDMEANYRQKTFEVNKERFYRSYYKAVHKETNLGCIIATIIGIGIFVLILIGVL